MRNARPHNPAGHVSPSTRREWIEITADNPSGTPPESPSTRREWIEMLLQISLYIGILVSLHTEGVD